LIARFAAATVLPFTFGTTQGLGMRLNFAVTVVSALSVTPQFHVPVHGPDQPAKVEPAAGVAVKVTAVPWA